MVLQKQPMLFLQPFILWGKLRPTPLRPAGGSFPPSMRNENGEIHKVFPRFHCFV